jgi:hypothetical protein
MHGKRGAECARARSKIGANKAKTRGPRNVSPSGIGRGRWIVVDQTKQERWNANLDNRVFAKRGKVALQIAAKHQFFCADLNEQQGQDRGE